MGPVDALSTVQLMRAPSSMKIFSGEMVCTDGGMGQEFRPCVSSRKSLRMAASLSAKMSQGWRMAGAAAIRACRLEDDVAMAATRCASGMILAGTDTAGAPG